MEQAFFENIRSEIIPLLKEANNEVLIAMAWFTSGELFQELLTCCDRGVKVKLIILNNSINFMYYAPDFNELIKHGGELRIANLDIGFMHHKFCIIDDQYVITGSYNWTYYAETRNIENIFVTDISSVIDSYRKEFDRLLSETSVIKESPRLSWYEIEQREDVNYHELNHEIGIICEKRNLPVIKVFKPKTIVQVVENRRTPYTSCHIGIRALDDKDKESFQVYIDEHVKLPFKSKPQKLYYDPNDSPTLPCCFIYGSPKNQDDWHIIKEVDISEITKGTKSGDIPISFSMFLNIDGSLRVDISCPTTGKTMMISALESKLVRYE